MYDTRMDNDKGVPCYTSRWLTQTNQHEAEVIQISRFSKWKQNKKTPLYLVSLLNLSPMLYT